MSDKTRILIDDIVRPILAVIFSTITVLIILTGISAATACEMEDGFTILSGERFSLETERVDVDVNTARDWMQWIHRTEALLPKGETLYASTDGTVLICSEENCETLSHQLQDTTPEDIFNLISTRSGADDQTIRNAISAEIPLWTIQIASTPFLQGAQDLTYTLPGSDTAPQLSTNGTTGGVLSESCESKGTCYKVLTGVFRSRATALKALDGLKAGGARGFVRRL